jgi:hypothetical protein
MALSEQRLGEAREQSKKALALIRRDPERMRDMVGQVTAILGIIEIQAGNSVTGVNFVGRP